MYIGKRADNTLEVLRPDFSTDNATKEEITRYTEVYQVAKTFVPEVKLVPKPKEQRNAILLKAAVGAEPAPDVSQIKRGRPRKGPL